MQDRLHESRLKVSVECASLHTALEEDARLILDTSPNSLRIYLFDTMPTQKYKNQNILQGDLFHSIKWLSEFPFLLLHSLEETLFSKIVNEGPPADLFLFQILW